MYFRVNFFPIPYIVVLLLLIAFVSVFNEVIYTYFAANFEINGIIVSLFIFCNIWILGSIAYYNRSAKLLSKILGNVGPVVEKQSIKNLENQTNSNTPMSLQSSYSIEGTLFDSPVFSSMLAKLDRKKKLDVTKADADEIAQSMIDNAARVLAPSKFLASVFVLCGLIGTFFGLLETIGGVAQALSTLASGGVTTDITKFIGLLSNPLQGMSTAFSASLFGLTSALVSNFGNHSAWQKLLFFTHKVRNYLLSNTGVFGEDPAKITVRDLLISLEESFDLLYRGLTNRLEDLTNNIATMGSVIVKTHERQEKMLRVILKDHELMEEFWKKFLMGEEGIMAIVDEISNRLSVVLPESVRKVFEPLLNDVLDSMDRNSAMLERSLFLGQESLKAQNTIVDLNNKVNEILDHNSVLLSQAGQELVDINDKLNLDQIASMVAEGNDIKNNMANLMNTSNNISHEGNNICLENNNLTNELLNKLDNSNSLLAETADSLNNANAIILDIKAISQLNSDSLFRNNALNEEIINNQNTSNHLTESILQSTVNSNTIGSDTLLLLGNMFEENNNINRGIFSEVSKVAYHNENMIRILDERFGMIVAFSSDLLITANQSLIALNALNDQILGYYQNMFFRLDHLMENLSQRNILLSNNLAVSDICSRNTETIIQKLDASNGLTLDNLQLSSKILCNAETINELLNQLPYNILGKNIEKITYCADNLSNQINKFSNSFAEYKNDFNKFINTSISNSQYLSNSIAVLNNNLIDNIKNLGEILNDITISLSNLNNISTEHKDLTVFIRSGMDNLLALNDSINNNILSLGSIFDNSISKIIEGINAINMASTSYSEAIKDLLSSIVNNLTFIAEINKGNSEETIKISKNLDNSIVMQDNIYNVNNEIRNILLNADTNIKGIGDVLTSVNESTENITHRLEDINSDNKTNAEETNNTINVVNKNIEKMLVDIATLVNNLNLVYTQHGAKVQSGLSNIEKGISSINDINTDISKFTSDIKVLLTSIETATSNKDNITILNEVKDKLNNLQSLKEITLNEFEHNIKPALNNFNDSFASINNHLSMLSSFVTDNKDALSKFNSDISNKLTKDFASLNTYVNNLNTQLSTISQTLSNQDNAFDNIIEQLMEFKNLVHDFSDVPKTLNDNASAIMNLSKAITLLEKSSENTNSGISKVSQVLGEQVQNLANVINSLDIVLNEEFGRVNSSNNEIYNSIIELTNEIATLGKNVFNSEEKRETTNKELLQDINKSFNNITGSVNEMKQLIGSNIGVKLIHELSKISGNQTEIAQKIEQIAPYINKLIKVADNISSENLNSELTKVITSLEKINSSDITNNNKLDLLLKAVDTLVAEMLNSRNVSQAILDIIAELGGFKNINK